MNPINNSSPTDYTPNKTKNFIGTKDEPLKIINYEDFDKFSKDYPEYLNDKPIAASLIISLLRSSIAGSSLIENLFKTGITEITQLADNPTDAYYKVIAILDEFERKHVVRIPTSISMTIENRDIPNERMRIDSPDDRKLVFDIYATFSEEGYIGVLYDIIEKENTTKKTEVASVA
jgi:hypothetical protein